MAQVIWTNGALSDLVDIAEYIEKDSPKYAQITVKKLYNKVEILNTQPKLGCIVPESDNNNIRELIEGDYRIIYEIISHQIHILTVHHSSRILNI